MAYTFLKILGMFGIVVGAGLLAFVIFWVLHDAFFGD